MPKVRRFAVKSKKRVLQRRPSRRRKHSLVDSVAILGRRVLNFYTPQVRSAAQPAPSPTWLDRLVSIGSFAGKLIVMVASAFFNPISGMMDTTPTVVGTIQSLLLGIDDFIISHPFCDYDVIQDLKALPDPNTGEKIVTKSANVPKINYRQAQLGRVSIRVSCSSELSKRAGQYCVALLPLSREESDAFVDGCERFLPERQALTKPEDRFTFVELQQFPRSVTKACDQSIVIHHKPAGFTAMRHRIGYISRPNTTKDIANQFGGPFLYKLLIGYSDMASNSSDPVGLYSADEALFNVEVSAKVDFKEPGGTFLRPRPFTAMDVGRLSVITPESCGKIVSEEAFDSLSIQDGVLQLSGVSQTLKQHIQQFASHRIQEQLAVPEDFQMI
jgi:hypothetical protein